MRTLGDCFTIFRSNTAADAKQAERDAAMRINLATPFVSLLSKRKPKMLLWSAIVGFTSVPDAPLRIRFNFREGGPVDVASVSPREWLETIRTGKLGGVGPKVAMVQIVGSTPECWTYDFLLKRLYYYPWRCYT